MHNCIINSLENYNHVHTHFKSNHVAGTKKAQACVHQLLIQPQ